MTIGTFITAFGLLLLQQAGDDERLYDHGARVTYLREALSALETAPMHTLDNALTYIRAMEQNACLSSFHRLRIECLLQKARKNCRGKAAARHACGVYSDLIITNILAEERFVPRDRRIVLMQSTSDFRTALQREVLKRYAKLTASYYLWNRHRCLAADNECLAESIDRYCMLRADTGELAWQYCSAAIAWFVGTSRPPQEQPND